MPAETWRANKQTLIWGSLKTWSSRVAWQRLRNSLLHCSCFSGLSTRCWFEGANSCCFQYSCCSFRPSCCCSFWSCRWCSFWPICWYWFCGGCWLYGSRNTCCGCWCFWNATRRTVSGDLICIIACFKRCIPYCAVGTTEHIHLEVIFVSSAAIVNFAVLGIDMEAFSCTLKVYLRLECGSRAEFSCRCGLITWIRCCTCCSWVGCDICWLRWIICRCGRFRARRNCWFFGVFGRCRLRGTVCWFRRIIRCSRFEHWIFRGGFAGLISGGLAWSCNGIVCSGRLFWVFRCGRAVSWFRWIFCSCGLYWWNISCGGFGWNFTCGWANWRLCWNWVPFRCCWFSGCRRCATFSWFICWWSFCLLWTSGHIICMITSLNLFVPSRVFGADKLSLSEGVAWSHTAVKFSTIVRIGHKSFTFAFSTRWQVWYWCSWWNHGCC